MVTAKQVGATRKKLRESQAAFAARFGVNQSTVNRWERYGPPKRAPIQQWIANVLQQATSPAGAAE